MTWQKIEELLASHRRRLDEKNRTLLQQAIADNIPVHCHKGCSNCCTLAVNCGLAEVRDISALLGDDEKNALIARSEILQDLGREATDLKDFLRRFRDQADGCPFLDPATQCCRIYEQRPLSCRSLFSTRPASWCGVDFATLHPLEKQAFLTSLNPDIVAYPTHYLAAPQEFARDLEVELNMATAEEFNALTTGNLIYLVWLELQFDLSESMIATPHETSRFLQDQARKQPYLLQFKQTPH